MYRSAMDSLHEWKNSRNRKPLLVRGARQVGKTWLMKEFGNREYEKTAYINFDNNERMAALFQGDLAIERIITALQIEAETTIDPAKTLIIFDEVQEVPRALTSLKYFSENSPEYHIVSAGSMLGVAMHPGTSFPVGKVDFLDLAPLDFTEFLRAMGHEELVKLLKDKDFKLITAFKGRYIDLLKQYFFIGGMPEVVNSFAQEKDFAMARNIQKRLLDAYEQDFSKHAPNQTVPRIRMLWQSLPSQLAKENRKFIYKLIRKGARAREYELAMAWLSDCGLIHPVNRVSKPNTPLAAYKDPGAFKLFLLDVGLLSAASDLDIKTLLEGNRIFEEFKGALTEQFVLQQLVSQGKVKPYYWSADKGTAEIDFVLQFNGNIVPLEVKASENLQAKSLKSFCQKYCPERAFRASISDYREEEWLTNLPLYAINILPDLFSE